MSNVLFFWHTMRHCDWRYGDHDQGVLKPVVKVLSQKEDGKIFEFHDVMAELLYHLDTKNLYRQCYAVDPNTNEQAFLFSRCVALINGPEYYKQVKLGRGKDIWDKEYATLLAVPTSAWAWKHPNVPYPHVPAYDIRTGSNTQGWK